MSSVKKMTDILYTSIIDEVLVRKKFELNNLSQLIWENPELLFEEKFAHDLLTDFLEQHGFTVVRHYQALKTAFRAEFQSAGYNKNLHSTICVICEYDALPGVGHACGHNLIAEAGVATGLALQEILKHQPASSDGNLKVEGRVVVMGTPAEEGGGGKVLLINAGSFSDIDFAMMVHPAAYNELEPIFLGSEMCQVKFSGNATHTASLACGSGCWERQSALDASVALYQHISLFRQQLKSSCRIHGIINSGIFPDLSISTYQVRAFNHTDLLHLKIKITEFANAAASATDCTVAINWAPNPYAGMIHSSVMSQLYKEFSVNEGVIYPEKPMNSSASTDMGNLSLELPIIHIGYSIGPPFVNHTAEFQVMSGSRQAQKYTLIAAKCMALTSVRLFSRPDICTEAKSEFQQKKKRFMGLS